MNKAKNKAKTSPTAEFQNWLHRFLKKREGVFVVRCIALLKQAVLQTLVGPLKVIGKCQSLAHAAVLQHGFAQIKYYT